MSSNSLLFSLNTEGKVYALSTNGSCWREFMYLGIEFKSLSAVPHFLWAVGGDRQIYLHVHGLEIPIRVKEESYENERWLPLEGFSGRLLPTDRYHFSSQDGTVDRAISCIRLPSMAWQWEGDWQLELTLDGEPLDHDGWSYAVDFPAQFAPVKRWKSCVRRRKWIRHRKFCAMNSWCAIAPLHKDPTQEPFMDVSIGGEKIPYASPGALSVWALTAQGRVMYRSGVSSTSPEGLKWISISLPPNSEVKQISVGPSGLVWAALWSGRALIRKGVTKDCLSGETWLEVKSPNETKLNQISVGFNSVWAISTDYKIWFRKGINGNNAGISEGSATGNGWMEISGSMVQVSVGGNDQVFAIGESDKCVYWRSGVSTSELTGKRWRMIQANMQMSRTSSSASVVSNVTNAKNSSTGTLEKHDEVLSKVILQNPWDESHSAPIEHTLPLKPNFKRNSAIENTDVTGKSYETTLKNPRAWSPVRSVGSVVGMEAHPDSDSSVFDLDSGIFYDDDVNQTAWGLCDAAWTYVSAGACTVDTMQLPLWFSDSHYTVTADMTAKWRFDILESLKNRYNDIEYDSSKFGLAIEEKGWSRSCEAILIKYDSHANEDCILSFHWLSIENTGTLSVFNPDGAIKFIINLSEITCINSSSEPGAPRITLTIPRENRHLVTLQFISEMEQEEWLTLLAENIAQVWASISRPSKKTIWAITTSGDILSWDPNTSDVGNNKYVKEFQVAGKDTNSSFTGILHNHFSVGSELIIKGCIFDEINRFHINLQGPELKKRRHKIENTVKDIPFHFNVRFDENVVVCNTMIFDSWGVEERHHLPLSPGQEFTVTITCTENGYKILVNEKSYCFYEHRLPPETVTSVLVNGPLKLYKLDYSSTTFILDPKETNWRLMGGHLTRVECCQDNVVWGISNDHRPWVYTGGWGGGPLKLGCNEGIHPMSDTRTYAVYENQRWNPLSGYTSTGLPTDRYMWSDVTGRHKRTREHTKLVNRHWHWISEWMIDYNTPGGVDGDGWQYAMDFPASYHGKKHFTDYVRRRRWYRKAQLTTEGPWIRAGSTPLLDISLWGSKSEISVWAITTNGDAICRTGVTSDCPAGVHWEHVNSPQSFVAISTCRRVVWVVGRKGEIFYRDGITEDCPTGTSWKLIEAPKTSNHGHKSSVGVKAVSLTAGAAWVVLSDGTIAVRSNVTVEQQQGKNWRQLDSDVTYKQVSAGEREVWAVSTSGTLYRRLGVTLENVAGTIWQQILDVGITHVSTRGVPF